MKRNFLTLVLLFLVTIINAGNSTDNKDKKESRLISGKIIDKKSGEEIAGAAIKINDKIVYSDLEGNFSASITTEKTEAEVSYVSYNNTKINIDPFSYATIIVELESK